MWSLCYLYEFSECATLSPRWQNWLESTEYKELSEHLNYFEC